MPVELTSETVEPLLGDISRQEALFALDLTTYNRITLPALVYLTVAVIQWSDEKSIHETIPVRLPKNIALRRFLIESGIGRLVTPTGIAPLSVPRDNPPRERRRFVVPFSIVAKRMNSLEDYESECAHFLNRLADALEAVLPTVLNYTPTDVRKFWSPSKEIIFNIFEHSESWGFGAGLITERGLILTYADLGVGIPVTLSRLDAGLIGAKSTLTDSEAIQSAFEFGVSRFVRRGRGTGLSDALRFVVEHRGAIECRSGRARVRFTRSGATPIPASHLVGTQITLFLPRLGGPR